MTSYIRNIGEWQLWWWGKIQRIQRTVAMVSKPTIILQNSSSTRLWFGQKKFRETADNIWQLLWWTSSSIRWIVCVCTVGTENLKKVQGKKNSWNQINQFREIAFLAVLNFFPVEKLIFGHFWYCKKCNLAKKNLLTKIHFLLL